MCRRSGERSVDDHILPVASVAPLIYPETRTYAPFTLFFPILKPRVIIIVEDSGNSFLDIISHQISPVSLTSLDLKQQKQQQD